VLTADAVDWTAPVTGLATLVAVSATLDVVVPAARETVPTAFDTPSATLDRVLPATPETGRVTSESAPPLPASVGFTVLETAWDAPDRVAPTAPAAAAAAGPPACRVAPVVDVAGETERGEFVAGADPPEAGTVRLDGDRRLEADRRGEEVTALPVPLSEVAPWAVRGAVAAGAPARTTVA
jgi:hypothetical protein